MSALENGDDEIIGYGTAAEYTAVGKRIVIEDDPVSVNNTVDNKSITTGNNDDTIINSGNPRSIIVR